ncbi:glycosyltransferase family 2 protein [Candidatus Berkelbacteria bacterium]|nr:glycosyltransferase family 2 protein [Candidatus Berkelbacteria bacterium]
MSKNHVLAVVPTYNEAPNIEAFIQALAKLPVDMLVVDDNSPDRTGAIVKAIAKRNRRVHLLARVRKSGLGVAYRAGFAWALGHGYEYVVSIDADFSHNPNDIAKLYDASKRLNAIAVGSRYVSGGIINGWSTWRLLQSRIANLITRLSLGIPVRDVTAGYKCYPMAFIRQLLKQPVLAPGYAFQVETLFFAHSINFPVKELPITFSERRAGASKVSGELKKSAIVIAQLMAHREALRQLVKFGLVGFVNVAIDFGVLNLLVLALHITPLTAGIFSTICALTNSYFLNRAWTFKGYYGGRGRGAEFATFLAVNGTGAAINWLIFAGLLKAVHLNYNIAKAIAILLTTFWNFFGSKKFVFNKSTGHGLT